MSGNQTRNILVIVVLAGVAVGAYFGLREPKVGIRNELADEFMTVLPADLTEPQISEIRGLLDRFFARARRGLVDGDDVETIAFKLEEHVARGSIERRELERFMAEVGFYTFRADPERNPEDGSAVHPLLEEESADTTGATRN